MKVIRLEDGTEIKGTEENITKMLNKLGLSLDPTVYYMSDSKGVLVIEEMNTTHLRNAIVKKYRQWVEDLRLINDPKEFVKTLDQGILDLNWLAMLREYYTRDPE